MAFIRKKRINNNYYYYLVKSIRTGPNSWKKYEKYIGKKKPKKIPSDILEKKEYDIIIIGAGPAGLFAAYELCSKSRSILVVDKGSDVHDRKKNIMCGVGGAGLFSDGKLNFTPVHGKTNLYEFLNEKETNSLLNYIDDIFIKFGAPKEFYTKNLKKAELIKKQAAKHDINLLLLKQKHLGSDKLPILIKKFKNYLIKNNVEFLLSNEVSNLIIKNNKAIGVELVNNEKILSKYIIACPGRIGSDWFLKQAKKFDIPIKHRGIEVGVRVEVKAKAMKHITDYIWDPSFFIISKRYNDTVRTFCTCPNGFVTREDYHGFIAVNGHCRIDKKSNNTNFALLSNVELTSPVENTIAYGRDIGKLATTIAGGRPLIQRLDDLKKYKRSYWKKINKSKVNPTLKDANPGDISMAIPGRIVMNIFDALKQLDRIIPGLTKDALVYGPELKFFSVRIRTDKRLETNIKNLFVAGDGVGVCGNIVGAAATGVIAARGVLRKIQWTEHLLKFSQKN